MPPTRRRSDKPRHKPRPVTRADLARMAGRARSTVTEALAGRLRPAALSGGRVDAAHPEVLRWAGVATYEALVRGDARRRTRPSAVPAEHEPVELVIEFDDDFPSVEAVHRVRPAHQRSKTLEQAELELAPALLPDSWQPLRTVARLAGAPLEEVLRAARADLAPAVTSTGHVDITSEAALRWFAAHPLTERDMLEASAADGYPLGEACEGELVNLDHPVARVWLARTTGAIEVAP